jgi:uncharacterized protein
MNRRELMILTAATMGATLATRFGYARPQQSLGSAQNPTAILHSMNMSYEYPLDKGPFEDLPTELLLWDYQPKSAFEIPKTEITKAKYPMIDMHQHGVHSAEAVQKMVEVMDATGTERSLIFAGTGDPERFAQIRDLYSRHPGRFNLWCSFDYTGLNDPGFGPNAIKALEQCRKMGAEGVGEITDKGYGLGARGQAGSIVPGAHPGDPRMDPLWDRAGQLGMPISIHVSDPIWVYEQYYPMNNHNEWLPAAWEWRIPDAPGLLGPDGLFASLESAVQKHPKTIFSACHLMQQDYHLARLGEAFDRHPNLYADMSARFQMIATIPRYASQFFEKYQDRLLYGTDYTYSIDPIRCQIRILETSDEHFYPTIYPAFNWCFWPMNGFALPDAVLEKIYRANALQVYQRARDLAA